VEAVRLILLMAPRDHELRGTKNCHVLSSTKDLMLNKNSLTSGQEIPCLLGKSVVTVYTRTVVTVCTRTHRRAIKFFVMCLAVLPTYLILLRSTFRNIFFRLLIDLQKETDGVKNNAEIK
jgi:hypothetical protein